MLAEPLSQIAVRVPKIVILFFSKFRGKNKNVSPLKLLYLFSSLRLGSHTILGWSSRSSTNSALISHWTCFFFFFLLRPCASAETTHSPSPTPLLTPTSRSVTEHGLLPYSVVFIASTAQRPIKTQLLKTLSPKSFSLWNPMNRDDFFAPFHLTI